MRLRTLPLVLAFALLVAACGEAVTETEAAPGSDDPIGNPTTGSTTAAPGRGWLDAEDLDWSASGGSAAFSEASDGGGDMADDSAADRTAAPEEEVAPAEGGSTELRAPEPFDPPVVDSPLRAGSIDDAEDVQSFLEYRTTITDSGVQVRPLDLNDSTVFTVMGNNGLPVLGAEIEFWDPGADRASAAPVARLKTTADGSVRFSPRAMAEGHDKLDVVVRVGDLANEVSHEFGEAALTVEVETPGGIDGSVPLDVHFVLDATGSMDDEIARLRNNMSAIAEQIDALPSAPDVRFGLTAYRDEGDAFVSRTFDLTAVLDDFLDALAQVQAEGGGDYPEAMDEALVDAFEDPAWRREGAVQLMFVVADAPPQITRQVAQPYTTTALMAAEAGVKIFPVAASGTDDQAEYAMRDLAFVTGGRFVFLSYGVGGSATGAQTDITADNYDELPLDQLVVRLVQDELAALSGDIGQTQTTTTLPATTTTFSQ